MPRQSALPSALFSQCHPEPIRFAQGKLREGSSHALAKCLALFTPVSDMIWLPN